METILINIDSKYRDTIKYRDIKYKDTIKYEDSIKYKDSKNRDSIKYQDESKFDLVLDKLYKNIISIKMISFELDNNNIQNIIYNLISSSKNNNYFKIHLPNSKNDPYGTVIYLDNELTDINSILTNITIKLNNLQNNEKYFYIFYLNTDTTITFDFNNIIDVIPISLLDKLVLSKGWYSIYGIVKIITNYINSKYNQLIDYINNNPGTPIIDLYNCNFQLLSFTLNIYDRRFVHISNSIRIDTIPQIDCTINNLLLNLQYLKITIYNIYLNDIDTYNITLLGTGILDKLASGTYDSNIILKSKYYINNNNNIINNNNLLYNFNTKLYQLKVNIENSFNSYYFNNNNSWDPISNLLDKTYLRDNNYITLSEYNNNNYIPNLNKDIPEFEIEFDVVNKLSLGYYLGFIDDSNNSIVSIINNKSKYIEATYNNKIYINNYLFLSVNNLGCINLNNNYMLSKIIFNTFNYNRYISYINNEYVLRQPINIQKLEIQLLDYLGNQYDLNNINYSFTLELKQIINTNDKFIYEKNNHNIFNK